MCKLGSPEAEQGLGPRPERNLQPKGKRSVTWRGERTLASSITMKGKECPKEVAPPW